MASNMSKAATKRVAPSRSFPDPAHDHDACLADSLSRAEEAFRSSGQRLTPLRQDVLREIASSHAAIGAYDILDRLSRRSGRRLAPISVYRALDSLVDMGLVHRLESRNAFFACHATHGQRSRQVILACESCGAVAEVSSDPVFDGIAQAAAKAGFRPRQILVEVSGQCSRCAAAA
jgi:Fur family zinc uptake transcriptional regulator